MLFAVVDLRLVRLNALVTVYTDPIGARANPYLERCLVRSTEGAKMIVVGVIVEVIMAHRLVLV